MPCPYDNLNLHALLYLDEIRCMSLQIKLFKT